MLCKKNYYELKHLQTKENFFGILEKYINILITL